MELTREVTLEDKRSPSAERFAEPIERRGDWIDGSLAAAACNAWNDKDLSVLIAGNEEQLTRGLGWFSIGLGLAEIVVPRTLERFLGIKHHGFLMRAMGLREIASGVGILTGRRPLNWLWGRVGGDIIDIATLGATLSSETTKPANIAVACAAVAGITVLDVRCAQGMSQYGQSQTRPRAIEVRKSIQINRSPVELYNFWRNFQNLPKFMSNVESVEKLSDNRSHWRITGPAGKRIEWDAEIVQEQPEKLIAWRSLDGAQVENSGTVRFEAAPGNRGCYVRVHLQYTPPGGTFGATVAKLFGREPHQQIHEDLYHLKQIMEAGEIITTEGQPAGRVSSTSWRYDRTVRRQVDSRSDYAAGQ